MSANLHKIIVGVDFGTTFTGVSYVDSSKTRIEDIAVIRTWPGPTREQDEVWKTPSRIAYKRENPSLSTAAAWGYQVESKMKSYSWMKLLLEPEGSHYPMSEGWDALNGDGLMKIPSFKQGARDVCADYLREIYGYTISILEKRLSPEVLDATPLHFWFTIPAIWSDKAKEATLDIAMRAGFRSRPTDDIIVITEPEAAAIATITTLSEEESGSNVKDGDNILVCDCGGGTADIITYLVNQTSPVFRFEELLVGTGGKCGSTFIDRNFHKWMARTFKSAWDNVKPERKGSGSRFMREFEAAKRDFGSQGTLDKTFELELVIPNAAESEHYNIEEGFVIFTSNEMKSFFRPVMQQIEKLLEDQVRQLEQKKPLSKIKKIVLAGGFGDSPYLNQTLGAWCKARGMGLICPEYPQASVVKGAALAGLKNSRPQKRKSRLHYGVQIYDEFREGVDPEAKSFFYEWDGRKKCKDRMNWIIDKGVSIGKDDEHSHSLVRVRLGNESLGSSMGVYTCERDDAPDWYDATSCRQVGTLYYKFQESDLSVFESKKHSDGRTMWLLEFSVAFDLFADKGILQFRVVGPNGETLGEASIEYN